MIPAKRENCLGFVVDVVVGFYFLYANTLREEIFSVYDYYNFFSSMVMKMYDFDRVCT